MANPTGSGGPGAPGGRGGPRRPVTAVTAALADVEANADWNHTALAVHPDEAFKLPLRAWGTPIFAILTVASVIFALSLWMDLITAVNPEEDPTFAQLIDSLVHQDKDQARNTLGGLGEVMAAVLGLALTVSSIIVQLAATRFTPHITVLFFRARTNVLIIGFFVISAVFVVWVNFAVSEYVPRWGVMFSMILMTMSLVLLFPYFSYVFDFLDPEKIVGRISADGLRACTPTKGKAGLNLDLRKQQTIEAVEHLANISLNAMQQKDKNIASSAADYLGRFAIVYIETKAGMRKGWMEIPEWIRQSPDFVSLSNEAIGDLVSRRTWLEWKIMRQYQMLFNEGLAHIKDVCYLIAIDTRRLGQKASEASDMPALDLAIKFFNTYMRSTINASDIRTAYNILHQYRQLGEVMLDRACYYRAQQRELAEKGEDAAHSKAIELLKKKEDELERRVVQIAKHMRYYGGITFDRGMAFITGVVAYDMGSICETAFELGAKCHDELLAVFLRVDPDANDAMIKEKGLRFVRVAQVILATSYLNAGAEYLAFQIAEDLKGEPEKLLRSIWQELRNIKDREFWEVQDRGSNFNYLPPERKEALPRFFSYFSALQKEAAAGDAGEDAS